MPTEFQQLKNVARRVVHDIMAIPANYYAPNPNPPDPLVPQLVTVRRTTKNELSGEMKGTNFNYAERAEESTYLIFWREEMPAPARNAIVMLATGVQYFVDYVEPPDGLTITVRVVVARPDQIAAGMEAP